MNMHKSAIILAAGALTVWAGSGRAAEPAQSADPVAAALAKVRDVKADLFSRESSVLGELPGARELADAQPNLREMLRPTGSAGYPFSAEQRDQFMRNYRYLTLRGGSRLAGCWPVGKTGIHARDINRRTEIVVVAIERGSPADGLVMVDDILLGANGRLFADPMDPRPALGYALVESATEAGAGRLTLQLLRAGEPMNVEVKIPVTGDYAPTWPYECPKSERMAAEALAFVKANIPNANRMFSRHGGGGFWTPLFLMASGDDEAMEMARRWAYGAAVGDLTDDDETEELNEPGGSCWTLSYKLINLCEYYLLTGDSLVLPSIRKHARQLALNQYPTGTWGHGRPTGYGPINNVGLAVFNALILARECGVEISPVVWARAIRFFGGFCGTNFPYGNGTPGGRSGRMDNGMNSMAAVAFELLGEHGMAARWARSVCYMWCAREKGHAEGIFTFAWGPQGAALAPPAEFRMFLRNLEWYYEMMNTRDGGFVFTRNGSAGGGRFPYAGGATPALALGLYLPRKRLRTLGAPKGVFGTRPPADLADAAAFYRHKRWKEFLAATKPYLADARKPHREYAKGLMDAYQRQDRHVEASLELIRKNIEKRELMLAREQLEGVRKLLGEMRPEMAKLAAEIKDKLYQGLQAPRRRNTSKPTALVTPRIALFSKASAAGSRDWQWLVPPAGDKKAKSRPYTVRIGKTSESPAPGAWCDLSFREDGWQPHRGAVQLEAGQQAWIRRTFTVPIGHPTKCGYRVMCRGAGDVYINGYRVAEARSNEIELRSGLDGLIKPGVNILAARLTAGRDDSADVGLKFSGKSEPKIAPLLVP